MDCNHYEELKLLTTLEWATVINFNVEIDSLRVLHSDCYMDCYDYFLRHRDEQEPSIVEITTEVIFDELMTHMENANSSNTTQDRRLLLLLTEFNHLREGREHSIFAWGAFRLSTS